MTLTFNELRKIKDGLPNGSMHRIARELGVNVDTIRNYFGGEHYDRGESMGFHIEPGPDGGIVHLTDSRIIHLAKRFAVEGSTAGQA